MQPQCGRPHAPTQVVAVVVATAVSSLLLPPHRFLRRPVYVLRKGASQGLPGAEQRSVGHNAGLCAHIVQQPLLLQWAVPLQLLLLLALLLLQLFVLLLRLLQLPLLSQLDKLL